MNAPNLIFSAGPPLGGPAEKIKWEWSPDPVAEATGRMLSPLRGWRRLDVLRRGGL